MKVTATAIKKDQLSKRAENDFQFHPADAERGRMHDLVRRHCGQLAQDLIEIVPEGRELSLALTNLEQTMMWANAGIARLV